MARSRSSRTIAATLATPAARELSVADAAGLLGTGSERPDATGAIGVPGNLNMSGFLTGEDYNAQLDGYQAYKLWDEMRRSDAQVNATLLMCKLPIKAATWVIRPASTDPQDIAIADFVRAALLDDDAMSITWSDVLDNALLKLDFGSSAHEKIWMVDAAGALRFERLAPRLPKTFYRWIEDDNGTLQTLQQFAPKGGRYGFYDIPADRLVLHVLNRQGNNWYGVSVLRAAYPHWFWKKQLYRIGIVGADRELVGIPRASLGAEYNETIVTLDKIETTLKGLRSYDRAYIIQPYGVTFDWMASTGASERLKSLVEFIDHHNVMIARNILQQFSAQGSQQYGSKGASQVTFDAFYDAIKGVSTEICAEFRQGAIKPLCAANFDMTNRPSPLLMTSGLGNLDATAVAENLSKLCTATLITPDDDIEDYLREMNGAPLMAKAMKGKPRVTVPGPAGPVPASPAPASPAPSVDAPPESDSAKTVEAAADGYVEQGRRFSREPTPRERQVFALHAVPQRLDEERAALARQLAEIRRASLSKLATLFAKKDGRDTAAFTDLRHEHLPAADPTPYVQAIRAAQTRLLAYGREQVKDEFSKQAATGVHTLAGGGRASAKVSHATSALVSSARTTGQRMADSWQSLALENAIRLRRSGLVGPALTDALIKELEARAESGALRDAGAEVNEAFGMGRALEASSRADDVESCEYSAVLDNSTCAVCDSLDGTTYDTPDEAPDTPNPDCEGGDSCRCVILYFLKPAGE